MHFHPFVLLFLASGALAEDLVNPPTRSRSDSVATVESLAARLLDTPAIATVGGIKPITFLVANDFIPKDSPARSSVSSQNALLRSFNDSIARSVRNPDLGFLFHKNFLGDSDASSISVFSRSAIARLLSDSEARQALAKVGVAPPRSVDALIALYRAAVDRGGYGADSPERESVIVGLCLGYPPADVLAYADSARRLSASRRFTQPSRFGNRAGPEWIAFSSEVSRKERELIDGTDNLIAVYRERTQSGISALEVLNTPEVLQSALAGRACASPYVQIAR